MTWRSNCILLTCGKDKLLLAIYILAVTIDLYLVVLNPFRSCPLCELPLVGIINFDVLVIPRNHLEITF